MFTDRRPRAGFKNHLARAVAHYGNERHQWAITERWHRARVLGELRFQFGQDPLSVCARSELPRSGGQDARGWELARAARVAPIGRGVEGWIEAPAAVAAADSRPANRRTVSLRAI